MECYESDQARQGEEDGEVCCAASGADPATSARVDLQSVPAIHTAGTPASPADSATSTESDLDSIPTICIDGVPTTPVPIEPVSRARVERRSAFGSRSFSVAARDNSFELANWRTTSFKPFAASHAGYKLIVHELAEIGSLPLAY